VKKIVAVIGPGYAGKRIAAQAEYVGYELARRGIIVICGGLGGVMAAACRGAKKAGGTTIGVLPGSDAAAANRWVDIPIVTGLREARNVVIVRTAQAAIAVAGGFGTLSEIAFALKFGKPVIGIDTWKSTPSAELKTGIISAATPEEAVELAVREMKRASAG
jgi:uncharacterized protein (TIGR00725 family)